MPASSRQSPLESDMAFLPLCEPLCPHLGKRNRHTIRHFQGLVEMGGKVFSLLVPGTQQTQLMLMSFI